MKISTFAISLILSQINSSTSQLANASNNNRRGVLVVNEEASRRLSNKNTRRKKNRMLQKDMSMSVATIAVADDAETSLVLPADTKYSSKSSKSEKTGNTCVIGLQLPGNLDDIVDANYNAISLGQIFPFEQQGVLMNPGLVMRNTIPVVMAGVLGMYGLIVAVIIQGSIVAPQNGLSAEFYESQWGSLMATDNGREESRHTFAIEDPNGQDVDCEGLITNLNQALDFAALNGVLGVYGLEDPQGQDPQSQGQCGSCWAF